MPNDGRPGKLTKKIAVALVRAVERGLTFRDAAALCGIHSSTVSRWRKRGEQENEGPFAEFCEAMARAQAKRTDRRIKIIETAALGRVPIRRVKTEPVVFNGIVMIGPDGLPLQKETVIEDYASDWKASAWLLAREWAGQYPRKEQDANAEAKSQAAQINEFLNETGAMENGDADK